MPSYSVWRWNHNRWSQHAPSSLSRRWTDVKIPKKLRGRKVAVYNHDSRTLRIFDRDGTLLETLLHTRPSDLERCGRRAGGGGGKRRKTASAVEASSADSDSDDDKPLAKRVKPSVDEKTVEKEEDDGEGWYRSDDVVVWTYDEKSNQWLEEKRIADIDKAEALWTSLNATAVSPAVLWTGRPRYIGMSFPPKFGGIQITRFTDIDTRETLQREYTRSRSARYDQQLLAEMFDESRTLARAKLAATVCAAKLVLWVHEEEYDVPASVRIISARVINRYETRLRCQLARSITWHYRGVEWTINKGLEWESFPFQMDSSYVFAVGVQQVAGSPIVGSGGGSNVVDASDQKISTRATDVYTNIRMYVEVGSRQCSTIDDIRAAHAVATTTAKAVLSEPYVHDPFQDLGSIIGAYAAPPDNVPVGMDAPTTILNLDTFTRVGPDTDDGRLIPIKDTRPSK